jgi:hypothetical protein
MLDRQLGHRKKKYTRSKRKYSGRGEGEAAMKNLDK